ncbi:hypothetical protein Q5P01_000595 [Channa striata]|uniref:Uncharacterized protein n=1 Tax=Channa striata TaxID=64152 RepID=A0AA88LLP1_CHASR|nr:hypothetical protein Q5P01_000595 [Channa striata]
MSFLLDWRDPQLIIVFHPPPGSSSRSHHIFARSSDARAGNFASPSRRRRISGASNKRQQRLGRRLALSSFLALVSDAPAVVETMAARGPDRLRRPPRKGGGRSSPTRETNASGSIALGRQHHGPVGRLHEMLRELPPPFGDLQACGCRAVTPQPAVPSRSGSSVESLEVKAKGRASLSRRCHSTLPHAAPVGSGIADGP